jgi:hypothetical protein
MTLSDFLQSPTVEESRLGETATPAVRHAAQSEAIEAIARKVFQRSADMERTTELWMDLVDPTINLLDTNRKKDPSWRVFPPPIDASHQDRFVSIQKWEGYVLETQGNNFTARLIDLTAGGPEEEAVFAIREVSEEDRPMIIPGAVFYWSIGDYTDVTGRQKKISELRFRRLPPLGESDIADARREGKQTCDWLIGKSE